MNALETREGTADLLQALFAYAQVTPRDVAKLLQVGERTVYNWLYAYSEPSYSTVVRLFRLLGVPMIPFIHDRESLHAGDRLRSDIHHYVDHVASLAELEDMHYNLTCKHGSSVRSQLALVSMLNHMQLEFRLVIAKLAVNLWEIASSTDRLQNTDVAMPNVEEVRSAIIKTHLALKEGKHSYTDI